MGRTADRSSKIDAGEGRGHTDRYSASGRWLLALSVGGAALAAGCIHTISLCVVAGLLSLAAAAVWWEAEPARVRGVATLLLICGAGLTIFTALQCIPLPL